MKYDALREKALANFEVLLNYWKVDYKKITNNEYDILATWRTDNNFGSCRFNIEKGKGADFAGTFLTKEDISRFGLGFDQTDFVGFTKNGQTKIGFDVIGLCQRIYNCNSYKEAIEYLNSDLKELHKKGPLIIPTEDAAERRRKEQEEKNKKLKKYALDLWESCKFHKFENSLGEVYLSSRNIAVKDKNIRFHPHINYSPLKKYFPAIIFKVQNFPESNLIAIHRIYLTSDGKKANIDSPKMALASIKGAGIWFGEPSSVLYLTEGPENALSLREMGANFVVSSIYGTNLHNIKLPNYVKKLIIVPDVDNAGMKSLERALDSYKVYQKMGVVIQEIIQPKVILPTGKIADINDFLRGYTPIA